MLSYKIYIVSLSWWVYCVINESKCKPYIQITFYQLRLRFSIVDFCRSYECFVEVLNYLLSTFSNLNTRVLRYCVFLLVIIITPHFPWQSKNRIWISVTIIWHVMLFNKWWSNKTQAQLLHGNKCNLSIKLTIVFVLSDQLPR